MVENLRGRRILIVEDDYLQASDLRRAIQHAGALVAGPTGAVEQALTLATGANVIDAAVLDVNIAGAPVLPVADALLAREIPFLFLTGYEQWGAPDRFGRHLICRKPIAPRLIVEQIGRLLMDI